MSRRNRHDDDGAGCAYALILAFVVVVTLGLSLGAQSCRGEDAPAKLESPAHSQPVTFEALTGRLFKPGSNRLFFGLRASTELRVTGPVYAVGILQGSALSDGEAINLSIENPNSFQSGEGFLGVGYEVSPALSVLALGGATVGIESGAPVLDTTVQTFGFGPRIKTALGNVWLGAGWHGAAGQGMKLLTASRIPIKGNASALIEGAIGGPGSWLRSTVAVRF